MMAALSRIASAMAGSRFASTVLDGEVALDELYRNSGL